MHNVGSTSSREHSDFSCLSRLGIVWSCALSIFLWSKTKHDHKSNRPQAETVADMELEECTQMEEKP